MVNRTNIEYFYTLLIYGEVRYNFADRFPNRPTPIAQKFTDLIIHARETNALQTHQKRDVGPSRHQRILDAEDLLEENFYGITRQITLQADVSNKIICKHCKN